MKRRTIFVSIAVLAAINLSGCSMFYPNPTPTTTSTPTPTKKPTPKPTPTPDPGLNKVQIHIIDSNAFVDNGYVEVVAEALKVLEDDGKCTLTLKQGSTEQKITVAAVQNVSSTVCAEMHVPLRNFKAADITYSVTYESSKSVGTSETGIIQVQ